MNFYYSVNSHNNDYFFSDNNEYFIINIFYQIDEIVTAQQQPQPQPQQQNNHNCSWVETN